MKTRAKFTGARAKGHRCCGHPRALRRCRDPTVGEIAIGNIEAQQRAAEALVAAPAELEAGLEWHALERRTDSLTFDFQRPRRQRSDVLWTGTAKLDGAGDRAITVYAPDGSRPVKTADFVQLGDDEAMGLFKADLFRRRRSSDDEANQQNRPKHQHHARPFSIYNVHQYTVYYHVRC